MGLFIQNHEKYEQYAEKRKNSTPANPFGSMNVNNGSFNFGEFMVSNITQGSSLFFQYWESEGRGGSDDNTEKKINKLEKKLKNEVYVNCGGNAAGLNMAIEKGNNAIKEAQLEIDKFSTGEDEYSIQINKAKSSNADADTSKLEAERANALQVAHQKLENAKLYKANFEALKGEEENILLQIEHLKDIKASPEIEYDVKEETKQLRHFNNCLSEFTNIIKQDSGASDKEKKAAAKKLQNAYFGTSTEKPIIDNKTAQNAWAAISVHVNKYLN